MDATSSGGDSRFPLDGGRRCLNLTATLGRRHADPVERIPDGKALSQWLVASDILPVPPDVSACEGHVMPFRELREAVYRLVRAAMAGTSLVGADVTLVNEWAVRPDLAPQLRGTGRSWTSVGDPVEAAMASLARDAVELLTASPRERIKECAHPDCSLLFVDDSQSGRRRWCSMERCGNRAKIAQYRRRTAH
ncbi:CGNR zinc finger domain-containing protein [Mycobacterium hodleri]|uniref:CGNR zinc finger domain-containing protein n=1 Tax=Mycolicibacterium hodleri TaxID=49897 RepID=UPI0021F301CA|nr:ABATE domain-containing protein [Mycolicibacterium hodleri]MCV7136531.1 CGNR zinc finger domain-containing protein [Mycolicibacterium hodleri]